MKKLMILFTVIALAALTSCSKKSDRWYDEPGDDYPQTDTEAETDTQSSDTGTDTANTESSDTGTDTANTETPDTGDTETPDTGDTETPDTGDTETPDTGDTNPDTGDTETPDTGDTNPDTGDTNPDTGDTNPDTGDTNPDSGDDGDTNPDSGDDGDTNPDSGDDGDTNPDDGDDEDITDSGDDEDITDSGDDEDITDTGDDEDITDTGDEDITDTGDDEDITDTGDTNPDDDSDTEIPEECTEITLTTDIALVDENLSTPANATFKTSYTPNTGSDQADTFFAKFIGLDSFEGTFVLEGTNMSDPQGLLLYIEEDGGTKIYFQRSGKVIVDTEYQGESLCSGSKDTITVDLEDVILEQVTINEEDNVSTSAQGGACIKLRNNTLKYEHDGDGWWSRI